MVVGGKSYQFVVELLGLFARPDGIADDGVLADADEAGRLANATAIGEMFEKRQDFFGGQAGGEQRSTFEFGEALVTGATVKQASLSRAIVAADGEIAEVPLTELRALRVLATEDAEVVHDASRSEQRS